MLRSLATAAAALALLATPFAAEAHRPWLRPSSTVLSGDESWVTVDAAASTDPFVLDHQPLRLPGFAAWAPDGHEVPLENALTGRYRTTFDVHLTQQGSYRIGLVQNGIAGSYMLNGEQKRLPRGLTKDNYSDQIPSGVTDVALSEVLNRNETYVTLGQPTPLKPTGQGLELVPVTHPNDLVAGEPATFAFLIDGKPAPSLSITIIPDGRRYRDDTAERRFVTDATGRVTIDWPAPGLYWLNATATDARVSLPAAKERRLGYTTTLEVLAP
ncbi:ABC transporter permease [Sphingomonas oleivorans]|uniref:ABC transporter permease n=1 Tax=Sphingomonas oleivorans TaxID=1735121 RepID=A0A2T5G250_9SPHN|nr:DUF4198 domain-containing protein [Sphingomonas oleivorans]PTQ13191.1 ABC transporter permease [Sphingomonas oleivorans]